MDLFKARKNNCAIEITKEQYEYTFEAVPLIDSRINSALSSEKFDYYTFPCVFKQDEKYYACVQTIADYKQFKYLSLPIMA